MHKTYTYSYFIVLHGVHDTRCSQQRTGKMPGADDSIVGSLCDAARPTFLFGCTPPSELISEDDATEIARKFTERGRVLAVDGYIVCELLARAVTAPDAPGCAQGLKNHFLYSHLSCSHLSLIAPRAIGPLQHATIASMP